MDPEKAPGQGGPKIAYHDKRRQIYVASAFLLSRYYQAVRVGTARTFWLTDDMRARMLKNGNKGAFSAT